MKKTALVKPTVSLLFCLQTLLVTIACKDKEVEVGADFSEIPEMIAIEPGIINEASGLVDSRSLNGYLWSHEDSGNPAELFLISKDGKSIVKYPLPGSSNRDWEDIAIGPGPSDGVNYLYIGDTGNNNANPANTQFYIYRTPELSSREAAFEASKVERITFKYPSGTPDAETLLLDPRTKDIFIVTKENSKSVLYRLPYPQSTTSEMTAELVGEVPEVVLATGGDISPDGSEIIVRNYAFLYYWKRNENESIGNVLLRNPLKKLPYVIEPQGEAVCFDSKAEGYYTFSEIGFGSSVTLNYYKRK